MKKTDGGPEVASYKLVVLLVSVGMVQFVLVLLPFLLVGRPYEENEEKK